MINAGMCHDHSREFEGLCKNCEVYDYYYIKILLESYVHLVFYLVNIKSMI